MVLFNQTIQSVIDFYTVKNTLLIKWTGASIRKANGHVWRQSVGYHLLILSKEQAGIERALGSTFFAKGGFSPTEEYRYHTRRYLGDSYLQQSKLYSQAIQERIDEHLNTDLGRIIEENRGRILRNNESRPSVELGEIWFANLTSYLNILKTLQDDVAENLLTVIDGLSLSLQSKLTIAIIALVIPTLLSPFIVIIINRLVSKMQHFNIVLRSKGDDERKERKRTQTLLYEMLPISIARKLLSEESVKPEFYNGVTLFFSDICGFNEIVLNSSPLQIIDMMNTIYRVFDSLLGDYDVYKVETIGDCYMVASGLPSPNDRHARELSNFALDVVGTFSTMTVPHQPRVYVTIRIGLNSGTVVAGVVGLKMPRYCIFGDTVNTASRMMSNGAAGRIHISESTKLQLDRKNEFMIESRGSVVVKGKGEMNTYWLNGRQIPPAKSPALAFSVDEDALSCI
ncbi:atrial natriuretic peptide receptor 2 [Patella vulgata]|uniref:atrial natriuretic peptide receptor 2 n=1 Tax=Patella vulgata TaxID=6465 RepID=UPI0024A9D76E|nr:atrial natriuretic peptide receptor 2 [Patella vulgata]XP_055957383.1 atrial natriuretic peptide receptor 2 [Patella vulgata]